MDFHLGVLELLEVKHPDIVKVVAYSEHSNQNLNNW